MNRSTTDNTSLFKHVFNSLLVFAMMALLSACAAPPPPPEPEILGLEILAAVDVNPDREGRPSPVIRAILGNIAFRAAFFPFSIVLDILGAGDGLELFVTTAETGAERPLG